MTDDIVDYFAKGNKIKYKSNIKMEISSAFLDIPVICFLGKSADHG